MCARGETLRSCQAERLRVLNARMKGVAVELAAVDPTRRLYYQDVVSRADLR